ncbi:hypothetical protein CROQUDRAFT_651320, partial [Cronartium quercuum f. sp. fusiforme G11]
GGQILILESKESINAKATEREGARLADQTIIDEEPDEDEEILNKSTKKRKTTEMRIINDNVAIKRVNNYGFMKLTQSIDLLDELEGLLNHKFHSVPHFKPFGKAIGPDISVSTTFTLKPPTDLLKVAHKLGKVCDGTSPSASPLV